MRPWTLFALTSLVLLPVPARLSAADAPSQEQALTAIAKVGGRIQVAEDRPGKPVVAVRFAFPMAGNADMESLKALPDLEMIDLSFTRVGDAGLIALKGLAHLKVLKLNGTGVTDAGLAHLKDLKSLETLELGSTAVTGAGLKHLAALVRTACFPAEPRGARHQGRRTG